MLSLCGCPSSLAVLADMIRNPPTKGWLPPYFKQRSALNYNSLVGGSRVRAGDDATFGHCGFKWAIKQFGNWARDDNAIQMTYMFLYPASFLNIFSFDTIYN